MTMTMMTSRLWRYFRPLVRAGGTERQLTFDWLVETKGRRGHHGWCCDDCVSWSIAAESKTTAFSTVGSLIQRHRGKEGGKIASSEIWNCQKFVGNFLVKTFSPKDVKFWDKKYPFWKNVGVKIKFRPTIFPLSEICSVCQNKLSKLMLMRCARSYNSFCSQVILVYIDLFRRNSLFSSQKSPKNH